MSVKIRLRRTGSNKAASYRVVACDSRYATDGRILETLGFYEPRKPNGDVFLKMDRVDYWKSVGAIMSDKVAALVKRAKPHPGDTHAKLAAKTAAS
ncbi:MAG: 30S ribosomal protein S16 [Kiritimatiellia bacterium]